MSTDKEAQPNLVDTLFIQLALPEMHGHNMAIASLIEETLSALMAADRLTEEQLETIFGQASERVAARSRAMKDSAKSNTEDAAQAMASIEETAKRILENMRNRLVHTSDENS